MAGKERQPSQQPRADKPLGHQAPVVLDQNGKPSDLQHEGWRLEAANRPQHERGR